MNDFFAMQLFTIIDYFLQLVISGPKADDTRSTKLADTVG